VILYPAIDLKDGACVRLYKGEMAQATVFNDNPAAQARAFQDAGCEWLHLVDLNGAFAGKPVNGAAVEAILAEISIPAQLGGGIRDMATIERWLGRGLARVILGTVAVENPDLVRDAARAFPGQVAVGIDARNGRVATKGWATDTDVLVTDLARSFEDAGRGGHHLHRYQPRRCDAGAKHRGNGCAGQRGFDPGDRLGRGVING